MRNSMRYDKRSVHHTRRGVSLKTKLPRVRILAAAFLILCGVVWLNLRTNSPTGDGTGKENVVKESSGGGGVWQSRGENGSVEEKNWNDRRETMDVEIDEEICDRSRYPAAWELRSDQVTILINGFAESRLPLLQRHVRMYSAVPVVQSIYILWGNTSTPADLLERWSFDSLGAPIYIVRQDSTSLNDRFLPRNYVKTRAVMVCDDDITVDAKSLGFALDVWREDETRIVGFFPRAHSYELQSKSWMYIKQERRYSIMLTKLMILATEYLYHYTCEMPVGVREYVDEGMNCEDIAMNFLVSSRSGKGPLLVEGKARDWGDTRNSDEAKELRASALSGRKNHRQDRGDCITAFQKLWNGMELRFSYSKASSDLENQVHCEKFGYLIDCDKSVNSVREARRTVGENVVSFSHRYAYSTFLSSDRYLNSSLLLAQSLRTSGTIHDLVLMVDPSCSTFSTNHVVHEHYDEVVRVNLAQDAQPWNAHGKLNSWLLLAYAKVVYLEVDSLVLANLDHLFQLSEPGAAPRVFMPGKFSTGLLVLKPSNGTYTRLLQSLDRIRNLHSRRRQYLLNSFFSDWFGMSAENRLPAKYNVPVVFSKQLRVPDWFDVNRAYEHMGFPLVVRYGSTKLMPKPYGLNSVSSNAWISARLKLFDSLLNNDYRPLDNDNVSDWAPVRMNSSLQATERIWPAQPRLSLMGLGVLPSETSKSREAFVTVLYSGQDPSLSIMGWAESFHHHHSFQSRCKTLLLVLPIVEPDRYRDYLNYFDEVRVVEPITVNGKDAQETFTLLHLWNQTDFDKLVYVASTSLFVQNCNSLLDFTPFAAVPSLFPPDTFSTQVMSIRPNQQTYNLFRKKLLSYEFPHHPVERFLNAHYRDWYQETTMHRISPSYSVSMVFESLLQNSALPWKVLNFDLDWLPGEKANLTELWKKTICDLKSGKEPEILMTVCGVGELKTV